MTVADPTSYVLVDSDVVYKRCIDVYRHGEVFWMRVSVPTDARPGKLSRYKARYSDGRLPGVAQPIDEATAKQTQADSLARWTEMLRHG